MKPVKKECFFCESSVNCSFCYEKQSVFSALFGCSVGKQYLCSRFPENGNDDIDFKVYYENFICIK